VSLRVLLVDGAADRAAWVKESLEASGFIVMAVLGTGTDLPRLVGELSPDVIVVDIDSPDRDILEGMRQVALEHRRPVVMFSQDGNADMIRASIEAGVAAFVVDS
jgi:two-component system, response regulator / RNA-binding antiterminator